MNQENSPPQAGIFFILYSKEIFCSEMDGAVETMG